MSDVKRSYIQVAQSNEIHSTLIVVHNTFIADSQGSITK